MNIDLKNKEPDIRHLYDMSSVIYDKEWLKNAPNMDLYYMYRGVKQKDDLRYDITIIPPKMLGIEFVKTKGHEHIGNYGEVYIVLEGMAYFLIQKRKEKEAIEVIVIKAKKGDVAVIPSGYGHFTINPSPTKTLKMANWVSVNCKSNYKEIQKMRGASYYYTKDGWIKNKVYSQMPTIKFEEPLNALPKNLDFLKK